MHGRLHPGGGAINTIPVTTAMAKQVVAGHGNDSVERVEAMMRTNQVRRIPVLDHEDRVMGLVSINDFARLAARARRPGVDRELVKTMAAVCQPRGNEAIDEPDVTRARLAG